MKRRTLFWLAVAAAAIVALPTTALGALTNEYGMTFAGESACVSCHNLASGSLVEYDETMHSRHVTKGIVIPPPAAWTEFKGSGSVATLGAPNPGSGLRWFTQGGAYSIAGLKWMTLFDYEGESRWSKEEGPLLFFSGSPATSTASPWLRISGLGLTHEGIKFEYLANATALSDNNLSSTCGMLNCHFTGGTQPLTSTQTTWTIPNPAVASQPTTQTKAQWARDTMYSTTDFNTTDTPSYDGMGVQCEKCHGAGIASTAISSNHLNVGVQLSHRLPTATVNGMQLARTSNATLGRSDVCGVCHGLRSAVPVAGTLPYAFGYTPNLFVRDFLSVNATRSSTPYRYTYTPTESEFLAAQANFALYPSGNPKNGGHGGNQYWAWAASAHSVRPQMVRTDPDNLPGARNANFNINGATTKVECLRCHSGEGYMTTKVSQIVTPEGFQFAKSIWSDFTVTKQTAGYMGQECVTCHDPHVADGDIAGNIRSADPAGARSNLGRTTGNASMCEDCHNWQVEVMANSLPLTEFNPQALPGRVSHPQRELLHGVKRGTASVMWEVEDMGEFMPGAKCQDCHMPKTDTAAEFTSHRMMIQEPGDAAAWGATGEDSCTRCHEEAGDTIAEAREVLQEDLEEWQLEASSTAAAAKVALDAAKLRPEYTSGLAGAKELYGRGWLNWNSYTNDGSSGAHNPPYIKAGLDVAKKMADSVGGSFSQLYVSSRITAGTLGAVVGHAVNGNGTSASHAMVGLEQWNGSAWVQMGNGMTDGNGNVAFMISPAEGTYTYRLRWDRCSNNNADKYSASSVVSVEKVFSRVTAVPTVYTIDQGRYFRLRGRVIPSAPGQYITIRAKKYGGSWYTLSRMPLSAYSTYSRAIKPSSRGYWYYRVYYGGTSTVLSSWSAIVRVRVR